MAQRRRKPPPPARKPPYRGATPTTPSAAPAATPSAPSAASDRPTEYCVDCCRDIAPGEKGHDHCQRIVKRPVQSDDAGLESVDARDVTESSTVARISTGIGGFDKILNGGLPKQGVVLLDGPPGIGKSTMFVRAAGNIAQSGYNVLYVSGEETNGQVAALANRLGAIHGGLRFYHCDHMERIEREIRLLGQKGFPVHALFVDSIQTIRTDTVGGAAGDVIQVRKVGEMLRVLAKSEGGPAILETCHVTKDGDMAGPKTLEHTCDIHASFGRGAREERFLWVIKNRFGPTGVLASMMMGPNGLIDAPDPSFVLWTELLSDAGVAGFVSAHAAQPVVVPVECQIYDPTGEGEASATRSPPSASGFESDRLRFLLDAMAMHCGIAWGKRTIRVRVPEVGGKVVSDPAIDLAVVAALWSAYYQRRLHPLLYWGEVGLSGRVTAGERPDQRLRLAASIRGPLRGVMVGDRSGLASGQLAVHPVRHLKDIFLQLERMSFPADPVVDARARAVHSASP